MKETEKVKEEERSYVILLTDVMKWTADIRATVFHLQRKGVRAHRQGDNIAVKRCSVPRVERILRDFGIEIGESETSRDRKETKMVSVDGTESKKIVVREITTCTCVGFFEEHLKYNLIVQGRYRALMWALKIYGIRGWEFWQGLFLQTSKPKV